MPATGTVRSGPWTRPGAFALAVAVALALTLASDARAGSRAAPDPLLGEGIVAEINATRAAAGARALRVSKQLARAARVHATSMARLGYFSHSSANGAGSVRRIMSYYPARGAIRWAVGEVLLWSTGDASPAAVVRTWLASPGHRAQLLRRGWRELGVAALRVADAPGVFGGRDVLLVVVDFGVRSRRA